MMSDPARVLQEIHARVLQDLTIPIVKEKTTQSRIEYICRCLANRAGVRLLMSCMLGKIDKPEVDPRKPYTEIRDDECFSGRTYD